VSAFASADQIARAVVAAARLLGADPLQIVAKQPPNVSGNPAVRARFLAFVGLRVALPECNRHAQARGVGFDSSNPDSNVPKIMRAAWWREDWVDEVVGAILAPETESAPAPAPVDDPASPEERLRRHFLPTPAPKRSAAPPLDMGEPAPGRSALDERRGVRIPRGEDEEQGRRPGKISLPRLKFMEREFGR